MHTSDDDAHLRPLTILCAEDDRMVRELICAKLRPEPYRVIEASSGDEALPLLQSGGIDVLVTDVSMPGELNGWALAEQARLIHPQIAIVYISSGLPDAARQVRGSVYLRKPVQPHAIVRAVRQVTSRRGNAEPDD